MDALAQLTTALAGRYTVDREIGRGGMATVYLARDIRHNRKVAVKVLNPELGAVLGVERFLSEIQVTANLQHPNLLPLFDSGEADGLLFYVMPYIEGESLRALLLREKQLPIDDALHIATSIASALDYAHRHGVIHRDLKPENILLHDGQPLVADFGIALAVSNAGGNRITQTGLSLGTPHYMSPEQATGDREIDGRTDIYSLGAVTYEMLVGEPPHDGKTSQAIIAKVLTDRPRGIRLSRPSVAPYVERAVERALEKLPADRFHTAHEFADALAGKGAAAVQHANAGDRASVAAESGSRPRAVMRALPWLIAAAALVVAGIAWRRGGGSTSDASVVRYEIPLAANATIDVTNGPPVAISRGGRYIAYVAKQGDERSRLFVRAADDLQAREVPGSEGAYGPFFSPDGEWIAFIAQGQLIKAPVGVGSAQVMTDRVTRNGATWSPSGWLVSANSAGRRNLLRIPAAGGVPADFAKPDTTQGEVGRINPVALADGKTVLYTSLVGGGVSQSKVAMQSVDGGPSTILDVPGFYPLGVVEGYLVFATAAGTIMAVQFDAGKRTVTGTPVLLADHAATDIANYSVHAQMSSDGALVYLSGVTRRNLTLVGGDGVAHVLGEIGAYSTPRLSPDGKRIAVAVGSGQRDIWIYTLPGGPFTPLTSGGGINDRPEWSADSKSVLFRTNRQPFNSIWQQPLDGSPARLVVSWKGSHIDEGVVSADGKYVLFQRDSTGSAETWYRAVSGDTTARQLRTATGINAFGARFSPDGKWIVFSGSIGTGAQEVAVVAFPGLTSRTQVSLAGGATPVWSPDGKRIYYTTNGQLVAATIGSTEPFTIASRAVVLGRPYTFGAVHADYDVAKDGRTVVALLAPAQHAQLVVVRNLGAELRARALGSPR